MNLEQSMPVEVKPIKPKQTMKFIRSTLNRSFAPSINPGHLLDELDRLFETGFPTPRGPSGYPSFPIDVYHDKDAVMVRAELPGFRKDDLQVGVDDDILTISGRLTAGRIQDEKAPKAETSIKRTVALPENLDYRKVSAAYENGVLTVTLPKRAEAKPVTVTVEVK
jgi:HSP20 family protein